MERYTGRTEEYISTLPTLVYSIGNINRNEDSTTASQAEFDVKRRIDLRRVAEYTDRELSLLPKAVVNFRRKHIQEILAIASVPKIS